MTQKNSNLKNNEEHIRISENDRRKHKAGRLTYLKRYLCEFCEMSSIQGLSYIVKDISLFERLWWILVLILSISGSFYMVCEIFDNLKTKPVLVSLATKEMSISDIPFPSVTICPESKISRNCLNYSKILKMRNSGKILDVEVEESLYFDLMALLCKTANHEGTISLINKSFAKMREKYPEYFDPELKSSAEVPEFSVDDYSRFLYQCSAIDLNKAECYWIKQKVPCEKVMTSIVTDEGLCYSFNIYDPRDIYTDLNTMEYFEEGRREIDWTPYDGYRTHTSIEDMYPRRAFLNGIQNSFTAVFYSDKRDVNYACRDFSTQGIRVSLHTPTRIPRLSQVFFSVGLNKLTTAAVIPTLTKTSKRIKHYHPEKRNCYFNSERKLKHFKFYSQSSCHFECWTNYTKSHCGCVSFYMPRDNETRVCNMENRFCLQDAELSYTEDLWRERVRSTSYQNDDEKTTQCSCLPLCSDLTYFSELSTSDWDFADLDNADFDGKRDNFSDFYASAVRIFFKNSDFLPRERDELYGFTDVISNIGGALGLIIGFSLVSLGEIVYFLTIRFIENHRKYGSCWGQIHYLNDQTEGNL